MKRLFLFILLAVITSGVYSQTLFTYGANAVDKAEFLRAYNKNKNAVTDKAMALREYLDLYIKFKLKVKAAKEMRIDTLASLANDLQNFRTQIEESYLNDESQVSALIQQAFDRSQKDIHVAYTFFSFKNSDTLETFKSAQLVYQLSGFVSLDIKRDTTKIINPNDIGFVTVFNLPYEFENIVYSLKPGESNKPYHGKNGYYIFKNIEERKAVGKIKAAQILIALPEGAKQEDKIAAGKLADSIYHAIQSGSDFGELAKQFSNDKMTYMSGGIMPEFGVGKYEPQFENKVFAIQKDGEVTPPFETKFGYHIIKRISKSEIPQDKTDDSYLFILKQEVLQDSRITAAKEKFVKEILKKLNFKKNLAIKQNQHWTLTDSAIAVNKKI
ncbi:MAG TPA: peptidylprolyl isomerase, partial [Chitinophagaceae bacterium]